MNLGIDCCEEMRAYQERFSDKHEGLEWLDDKRLAINGCCGGGCFVLTDAMFCPWCGAPIVVDRARRGGQ